MTQLEDVIDGKVISDPESLLSAWTGYFKSLSRSRSNEKPGLQPLSKQVDILVAESFKHEEMILDIPFSQTEVIDAVARLKKGKSAGPDGLQGEHSKFGGNAVVVWLKEVLIITELEVVPEVLKI